MTGTSCRTRLRAVAFGNMRSAPAMHRRALGTTCGTPAMACCALAMRRAGILRMRRRLAGPVSVAHEPAKVQAVIVRNFSPALPRLVQRDDVVEALPRGVGQQVRLLYSTPAKSGRSSLGLQRLDGNSGRSRNSILVRSARRNSPKQ